MPSKAPSGRASEQSFTSTIVLFITLLLRFRVSHERARQCSVWLLKSVGVKLKVFVNEEDGVWSGDDDVDGFVQLLRLAPARGASTASWTQMTIRGLRPSHKTRSYQSR